MGNVPRPRHQFQRVIPFQRRPDEPLLIESREDGRDHLGNGARDIWAETVLKRFSHSPSPAGKNRPESSLGQHASDILAPITLNFDPPVLHRASHPASLLNLLR